MANFLEQLAVECYEFRVYVVRRNVRVGKRGRAAFTHPISSQPICFIASPTALHRHL
jgi:hypothetical protein